MLELEYEMTLAERIEGPLGPTAGAPARLCWKIAGATLAGPRITASLATSTCAWCPAGRLLSLLHHDPDLAGLRLAVR